MSGDGTECLDLELSYDFVRIFIINIESQNKLAHRANSKNSTCVRR